MNMTNETIPRPFMLDIPDEIVEERLEKYPNKSLWEIVNEIRREWHIADMEDKK